MYPDTVHAIGGKVQTQNPDDTSMPRENREKTSKGGNQSRVDLRITSQLN